MKEKLYSVKIANAIKSYLEEDDWHFSFDEKKGLFKFNLSLKSKIKNISYIIDVKEDEYIVFVVSPIGADVEDKTMMSQMAEFICRANYGLKNGNCDLDMRDGEVRYKSYVDCENLIPTEDVIQNSIHCPAAMFKRYSSGIISIIFGSATAKDAIDMCQKEAAAQISSLLSKLEDDDEDEGESAGVLAKLIERIGSSDEADPSDPDCVPTIIKTDLFGTETEGDDN